MINTTIVENLTKWLSVKRKTAVVEAVDILNIAIEKQSIYNVDFVEVKSTISRAYQESLETLDKCMPNSKGILEDRSDDLRFVLYCDFDFTTYCGFGDCKKRVRMTTAALASDKVKSIATPAELETLKHILLVHEAIVEIKQVCDSLKDKIVKGHKPSAKSLDLNTFVQSKGNKESQELVLNAITKGITPQLDANEKSVKEYFQRTIDGLVNIGPIRSDQLKQQPIIKLVLMRCFDFQAKTVIINNVRVIQYEDIKKNELADTFAEKEAREQRKNIELKFLEKNNLKLSAIVDLKGNLVGIEELPQKPVVIRSGEGTIEAGFVFKFADNSEFTVINKIISKDSWARHNPISFLQFPTTFHQVIYADGTKMKMPSEEKMIKKFAKGIK